MGNKYRLGRKIGSGSFGDIYLGTYYCISLVRLHVTAQESVGDSSETQPEIMDIVDFVTHCHC